MDDTNIYYANTIPGAKHSVQNQKPSNCLSHPRVDFEVAHQIQNQFDIKSYLSTEH